MFKQSNHRDDLNTISDPDLWKSFQEGNREALSELFIRYYDRIYHYGIRFLPDEDVVKDGIQQLFFRLWKKRSELGQAKSVYTYLLYSLRRILLRQKTVVQAREDRNIKYTSLEAGLSSTIEDEIIFREEKEERKRLFQKALNTLSDRQKEALSLRLHDGLTNDEIARVMGLSNKSVRNLIYEATNRMKDHIFMFKS